MLLAIENVRRFEQASLEVRAGRRTVVVGTNNSGKTTLIDYLSSSFGALPALNSNISSINTNAYRVGMPRLSRPRISLRFKPTEFQVETEVHSDLDEIEVEYHAALRKDRTDSSSPTGTLLALTSVTWKMVPLLRPALDLSAQGDLGSLASIRLSPSLLGDGDDWTTGNLFGNHPITQAYQKNSALSRLLRHVVDRVFYLPANRFPEYGPNAADRRLTRDHILQTTPYLKRLKLEWRQWLSFQASVQLLFDEIQEMDLRETGDQLAPFVRANDQWVAIGEMGFGFRNATHVLAVLAVAPRGSLLLIDEPEIGLNQSKQRDLAHLLEVVRPDVTIVIATQSEAFCKAFGSATDIFLAEQQGNRSFIRALDVRHNNEDRLALAKTMGMDPLYLLEGGKIIFVEGRADREILTEWLTLNVGRPLGDGITIQDLGGCGKISEEFAKPLFETFRDRIFFVLDSDGASSVQPMSPAIGRLVAWLDEHGIRNRYVLKRREIENYLGASVLARVVNVHPGTLPDAAAGQWADFKAAIKAAKGYYEEAKVPISAFHLLEPEDQKSLFGDENASLLRLLTSFISG